MEKELKVHVEDATTTKGTKTKGEVKFSSRELNSLLNEWKFSEAFKKNACRKISCYYELLKGDVIEETLKELKLNHNNSNTEAVCEELKNWLPLISSDSLFNKTWAESSREARTTYESNRGNSNQLSPEEIEYNTKMEALKILAGGNDVVKWCTEHNIVMPEKPASRDERYKDTLLNDIDKIIRSISLDEFYYISQESQEEILNDLKAIKIKLKLEEINEKEVIKK